MRCVRAVYAVLVLCLLTILACSDDGPTKPQIASEFLNLDFSKVAASGGPDYWEMHHWSSSQGLELVGSWGIEWEELGAPVQAELDSIAKVQLDGFLSFWTRGYHSFYFLLAVQSDKVELVGTTHELKKFLGFIDNTVEALFLTYATGYYSNGEIDTGSIARIPHGYEIVVLRVVSECPMQIDRFLLHLDANSGDIQVVERELWDDPGWCP